MAVPDQDHVLTEMSLDFEMWILVIHPDLLPPLPNWQVGTIVGEVHQVIGAGLYLRMVFSIFAVLCELFTLAGSDDVLATQAARRQPPGGSF